MITSTTLYDCHGLGYIPEEDEYTKASKRLVEKALSSGDAQMLLDVKKLMDTVSILECSILKLAKNV